MNNANINISELSPEQIWNQLEYETTKNPIENLFSVAKNAGSWIGTVPGGDEDYTNATVYSVRNTENTICNLLLLKHESKEIGSHEYAYLPNAPTEGCFVQFGEMEKIILVCPDLLSSVALADRTGYAACFTLYPENLLTVATELATNNKKSNVVICADNADLSANLPKNLHHLKSPRLGFYEKAISSPDEIITKLNDCIESKNNQEKVSTTEVTCSQRKGMNGVTLIRQITNLINECISIKKEPCLMVALYILFTYLARYASYSPILGICSPTKRCGKSNFLEIIEALVLNPFYTMKITKSALEIIANESKTPILDELDTYIHGNNDLIGLLNGGVGSQGRSAITGKQGQVNSRITYGAKVFAMIGRPPETIFDRSIVISLLRKKASENKSKAESKKSTIGFLNREIAKWCESNSQKFVATRVVPLDIENDRFRDNYEPLLRVAACISPSIEIEAREGALILSNLQLATEDGVEQLIIDIHRIFKELDIEEIKSNDLLQALCSEVDSVWRHSINNRPLTVTRMASMLESFGIHPGRIWFGKKQARGYRREWFKEAFEGYCQDIEKTQ